MNDISFGTPILPEFKVDINEEWDSTFSLCVEVICNDYAGNELHIQESILVRADKLGLDYCGARLDLI